MPTCTRFWGRSNSRFISGSSTCWDISFIDFLLLRFVQNLRSSNKSRFSACRDQKLSVWVFSRAGCMRCVCYSEIICYRRWHTTGPVRCWRSWSVVSGDRNRNAIRSDICHRCNKRFYVFYSGHVFFTFFFYFSSRFFIKKNVVKCKV